MKRLHISLLMLLCFCAGEWICAAQSSDPAAVRSSDLVRQLAGDGSLVCSFSIAGGFSLCGATSAGSIEGKAWLQDECYRIEAASFLILCDGSTRWIYNSDSDELYVENSSLLLPDSPLESLPDGSFRMVIALESGEGPALTITVSNLQRQKEKYPAGYFMMDTDKISPDTIVTDLR